MTKKQDHSVYRADVELPRIYQDPSAVYMGAIPASGLARLFFPSVLSQSRLPDQQPLVIVVDECQELLEDPSEEQQ